MGGHWQYHYIYGDQKNEGGAVRGLRKCGYQIQHRSVGRPSVRKRRGRRGIGGREREREEAALTKYRCLPGMTMKMNWMFWKEDIFLASLNARIMNC